MGKGYNGHRVGGPSGRSTFQALGTISVVVALMSLSLSLFFLKDKTRASPDADGDDETILGNDVVMEAGPHSFHVWPERAKIQQLDLTVGLVYKGRRGLRWAVQAQASLPPNRRLLAVPFSACITAASLPSNLATLVQSDVNLDDRDNAVARVVAVLLIERRKRTSSKWYAWLQDVVTQAQPDNMLSWSPEVVACQHEKVQKLHKRTMDNVQWIHTSLQKNIPQLINITEKDVAWAYSVVLSRGWDQPAPHHVMVVPFLDVTNLRTIPHGYLQKQPSGQSLEPNAVIQIDGERQRAVLVTTQAVPRGGLLFSSFGNRRRIFATDTVQLYGSFDPYADAVPAQVDHLGDCKDDESLLYFVKKTGEPSEHLLACATKITNGDKTEAYSFLARHVKRLVADLHREARAEECKAVDKTEKALVVRLEMFLRSGYLQALAHLTQQ